ncbi:acyl-CoA dehydrogenase family protein [Candidatus Poribacteria bacterium]|nr:acyl-CoA dehydrogenase family protein [Candidatus Poribacteria bacterium]
MSLPVHSSSLPGAGFLHEVRPPAESGFPEDLTPEDRELRDTVRTFLEEEVAPRLEELDHDRDEHVPPLLRRLGELGFYMAENPEEFGGLGLGLFTMTGMMEQLGRSGGFGVAAMVQAGIGMQPVAVYGTDEQREAYLPALCRGEIIGAYALTEPGYGSDALAGKTSAVWDEAAQEWVLNGAKQFITNARWAEIFTVFAQVEGNRFTAFLVPAKSAGLEVLDEEDKMGIKCSSTCALRLTDVRVPANAQLGEVGKGHKIALNMLNLGRLKLGITMLGANKMALRAAVRYGLERKQFSTPVVQFGLMRQKVADCASLIWAGEAVAYRTSRLINAMSDELTAAGNVWAAKRDSSEEYAMECSIAKIFLTESATRVADHTLQMLGGYGFIEEFPLARNYRDVRVSRLYEGTNEINRLVIVNTLVRRVTGQDGPPLRERIRSTAVPGDATELVRMANELRVHLADALEGIVKFLGDVKKLRIEQELIGYMADMMIQLYAADSSALRAAKLDAHPRAGREMKALGNQLAALAIANAARGFRDSAEGVFAATLPPDQADARIRALSGIRALATNRIELDRAISDALIGLEGEWPDFA